MATFKTYKNKKGERRYRFKVYLGIDPVTGKRIETSRQGFNTKKEAQIALRNLQSDFENNGWNKSKSNITTMDDLFYFWFDNFKKSVKLTTANAKKYRYESILKNDIGNYKFRNITPEICQKITNKLASKYKAYTAITSCLSQPLDYAVRLGLIDTNPFKKIIHPKATATKHEHTTGPDNFYSKKELNNFLSIMKDYSKKRAYNLYPLCRLLAFSGMRIGEALALKWNDIDFENKLIHIYKTTYIDTSTREVKISSPKTSTSTRDVYIDDITLSVLNEWHDKLKSIREIYKTDNNNDFVFTSLKNGKLLYSANIETSLKYFFKLNPELKVISPHGFRHTHASLLFEAGATIKEVQERLGHKNVNVTLGIYTHVTKGKKKEIGDIFSKYIDF